MQKIFLPGWGVPIENYSSFIEEENFDLVIDYGFFNEKADAFDFILEQIKIEKDTIVYAYSMGVLVALRLALKANSIKEMIFLLSICEIRRRY